MWNDIVTTIGAPGTVPEMGEYPLKLLFVFDSYSVPPAATRARRVRLEPDAAAKLASPPPKLPRLTGPGTPACAGRPATVRSNTVPTLLP